jgi:hypothetical protein
VRRHKLGDSLGREISHRRRAAERRIESARRGRPRQGHVDLTSARPRRSAVAVATSMPSITNVNATPASRFRPETRFLFRRNRLRELHLHFASDVGVDLVFDLTDIAGDAPSSYCAALNASRHCRSDSRDRRLTRPAYVHWSAGTPCNIQASAPQGNCRCQLATNAAVTIEPSAASSPYRRARW